MNEAMKKSWDAHRLAYISFALSLLQFVLLFCLALFFSFIWPSYFDLFNEQDHSLDLACQWIILFLFCLCWLNLDSRRLLAVFALIFLVAVWLFCVFQLALAD